MQVCRVRVAVCLVLLLALGACVSDSGEAAHCDRNLPTREDWKVPLYPGAQQVPDTRAGSYWELTTTFQVNAEPNQVNAFYEDALVKAGWRYDGAAFRLPNCCYYLHVLVSTEVVEAGHTLVTIQHNASQGCG